MFPYEKRYKYPHIKPQDKAIWERFIDKNPEAYDSVDYDMALGSGAVIARGTEEALARDFKILTQYKIDVIGYVGDEIHIIELKPSATPSTLGQVLGYVSLYKNFIDPEASPKAVVITDIVNNDMLILAHEMNVTLKVV